MTSRTTDSAGSHLTVPSRSGGNRHGGVRTFLWLLLFVALTVVAATMGGLASQDASSTYSALNLPAFAPPAWLFGPAWTALYVLIALAGWLVFLRVGWDRALTVWLVQLALNAAWTPLFFGAGLYTAAFVEIAVLWLAIVLCTVMFFHRRPVAGWLLVPYLVWVTYAGALNLGIVLVN